MRPRRLPSPSLLALALATACTDDVATAPEPAAARPMLDVTAAAADPISFCNSTAISIRDNNSALPYPSTIVVSGVSSASARVE